MVEKTPYRSAYEIIDDHWQTHVQINEKLIVRIDYIKRIDEQMAIATFTDGTRAWIDDDCLMEVIEAKKRAGKPKPKWIPASSGPVFDKWGHRKR